MRIIDTHTHIYQPDFDEDISDIINRAKNAGVEKILLPNIDIESIERLEKLSSQYSGYCFPMMGLHPTSVTKNWKSDLNEIKSFLDSGKYIAIGEIGIDLYWDKTFEKEQKLAFEEQLSWSIENELPVSIHTRNAIAEAIECIKNVGEENLKGIFHSFGGTLDEMDAILNLNNFYLGINGVVTYKNSSLPEVLSHTDLSRIVIETDAPYLPPVPYRGKRNEPSYCIHIIEKLAEIFRISPEEVGEITSNNAAKIFNL